MIARLVVDTGIEGAAEARWTMSTLLDLAEVAWIDSLAAPEAARAGDGPTVFVGRPAHAPADAALVAPWAGLAPWEPAGLALATFDGVTLPTPGGRVDPPETPEAWPAPWLRAAFALLSREEERLVTARDQWDCFAGTMSRLHALGALERPLVNALAARAEHALVAWAGRAGGALAPNPRWPGGARFAVALTHDVDEVRYASWRDGRRLLALAHGPRSYAFRAGLAMIGRRLRAPLAGNDPYWTFDRWVLAEESRGFRSSFYFCAPGPGHVHEYDATYRFEDPLAFEGKVDTVGRAMTRLVAKGFDVGLHGTYDSHVRADVLAREKAMVEAACEAPITGTRQHYLRFDVARTWAAQEQAGFTVDSTLGYNEAIGFRAGVAGPFAPYDPATGRGRALLELPLTVMDGTLFRTLGLDGPGAAARTIAHLEAVREAGGLAVLLWHPNAAAERLYPGWWEAWIGVLDWLSGQPAWVTDAATIGAWWRGRTTGEADAAAV